MKTGNGILSMTMSTKILEWNQGRIGPAAPPPLRAVGPWLNHAFFYELICCETYLNFHQKCYNMKFRL